MDALSQLSYGPGLHSGKMLLLRQRPTVKVMSEVEGGQSGDAGAAAR